MNGIHGTTVEIADRISKEGFQKSPVGRAGPGVYFWRYFNNEKYAKHLAYKWWEYSNKVGNYNRIGGNTNCCFVSAKIEPNNCIDISHGIMREIVRELILTEIDKIKVQHNEKTEEEIISGLFVTFVKQIENNEGILLDALVADVPAPKGAPGSVGKYMGSDAEVIIVIDLKIINQITIEET